MLRNLQAQKVQDETRNLKKIRQATQLKWAYWMMAEGVGTFLYVFIGTCFEATFTINRSSGFKNNLEDHIPSLGWGLALSLAYIFGGGISGGQFNGAVTMGLVASNKTGALRLFPYWLAQMAGALLGTLLAFFLYMETIVARFGNNFAESIEASAILVPQPKNGFTLFGSSLTCFVATFVFVLILHGITDKRNLVVPKPLYPLLIGVTNLSLVLFALSPAWHGSVIVNPTADFAARFAALCLGLQTNWVFGIVGSIGSMFGGVAASIFYVCLVEYQWDIGWPYPPAPVGRVLCTIQPDTRTATQEVTESDN